MTNFAIALVLKTTVQQELAARICYGLQGAVWTEPESLHLIVRQLGPLTHPQVDEIKACLDNLYFNPFEMELSGIKYMPMNRSQGHLWLQANENEPMKLFKRDIEAHIKALKIAADKHPPHIYLGSCLPQKVGEYLISNGLFHAPSGEMKSCGFFAIHASPKKIYFQELAHCDAAPRHSGAD